MTVDTFLDAMASFPTGVTIVTTVDENRQAWGFTANAFCSVSVDPPLVLVCLANDAQCHHAFQRINTWCIHIIDAEQQRLAIRFATKGADKFAGGEFASGPERLPILPEAPVRMLCTVYARYDGGDHTILVAHVDDLVKRDNQPALYGERTFRALPG